MIQLNLFLSPRYSDPNYSVSNIPNFTIGTIRNPPGLHTIDYLSWVSSLVNLDTNVSGNPESGIVLNTASKIFEDQFDPMGIQENSIRQSFFESLIK